MLGLGLPFYFVDLFKPVTLQMTDPKTACSCLPFPTRSERRGAMSYQRPFGELGCHELPLPVRSCEIACVCQKAFDIIAPYFAALSFILCIVM